jgi:RNA polymerase sigma-70 factor (ECF subfamily)
VFVLILGLLEVMVPGPSGAPDIPALSVLGEQLFYPPRSGCVERGRSRRFQSLIACYSITNQIRHIHRTGARAAYGKGKNTRIDVRAGRGIMIAVAAADDYPGNLCHRSSTAGICDGRAATQHVAMAATTSDSTSSSLIARVKSADPEAWERLSTLYTPLVYGWCRHSGLTAEDAADVAQDVFAAVIKAVKHFRHDGPQDSFRGWLWTITRNEVRKRASREARQPQARGGTDARRALQGVPDYFESDTAPVDAHSETRLVRRAAQVVRNEFEPATWQAFWRTAVDGQKAGEIADELEMSPGAVRQAKYRVLKRLREFFSAE